MKITSDLSGIDKFVQDVRDELKQKMIDIAHEGVQQAKDKGEYKNHTYNLRSAPGARLFWTVNRRYVCSSRNRT